MLKQILTGISLCAFLSLAGFPAQAQTQQQPKPQAQPRNQTAPESAPGSPSSGASNSQVSSQEVQKFANAIKEMRTIQNDAHNQAEQVIQKQGLTVDRFNALLQSQQPQSSSQSQPQAQPNAQASPQASPQEQQKFQQALTELTQLQQDTQRKLEAAVTNQGLTVDRFNQVFAMVRQDPNLRQQVEQQLQR
jgi:hypothetical protein